MLITKIVSGGQTGVDRGALEAALELGFPYGGLVPKGRLAEDGIVPEKFDQMEEASRKGYPFRTEWNVVHSDATLIIAPYDKEHPDRQSALSGGTMKTYKLADKHKKPCQVIFNIQDANNLNSTLRWLKHVKETYGLRDGIVLNVAGPRESKHKGAQAIARKFISGLIQVSNSVD